MRELTAKYQQSEKELISLRAQLIDERTRVQDYQAAERALRESERVLVVRVQQLEGTLSEKSGDSVVRTFIVPLTERFVQGLQQQLHQLQSANSELQERVSVLSGENRVSNVKLERLQRQLEQSDVRLSEATQRHEALMHEACLLCLRRLNVMGIL